MIARNLIPNDKLYKMMFERNYKVFGKKITKLKDTPIMIIGLGGVGGVLAELLVRMGFNKLIISDGIRYKLSNINRQIGATFLTSLVNRPKVDVMEQRLLEINPLLEITSLKTNPRDNFDIYLEKAKEYGVTIIANCIDVLEDQIKIAELSRLIGAKMIIGGVIGDGTEGIVGIFLPNGLKYEEIVPFLNTQKTKMSINVVENSLKNMWFSKYKNSLPKEVLEGYITNLQHEAFPTFTPIPWIIASFMSIEIGKIVLGFGEPIYIPKILYYSSVHNQLEILNIEKDNKVVEKIFPWRP